VVITVFQRGANVRGQLKKPAGSDS
jgi:hypothetical protein